MNDDQDYSDDDYDDDIIEYNDDDDDADLFFNIDGGGDESDDDISVNVIETGAVKPDPKYKISSNPKKPINRQRAVKTSFSGLIKIRNKHHKRIFIETVQKMVLKNTEIAVRCGMITHHVVMNCVDNNINEIPDFTHRAFVEHALNYDIDLNNESLIAAKEAFDPHFTPVNEGMEGRPWLLGYLARIYRGNIVASTKAKWKAVIKHSVDAYGIVHLRHVSKQLRYRIKNEIRRRIFTPASDPPNNTPDLARYVGAVDLVQFHRNGFLLVDDQVLDKRYINANEESFRFFILHYGFCLRRQENLELEWNDAHPTVQIGLKKCLPMPFYKKQQRKSVYIDKLGLYHILKAYRLAVRSDPDHPNPDFQFPILAPHFPTISKKFNCQLYSDWMRFLFRINKLLDGKKEFKTTGVGMTTNAVCASVLYKIPHDTTEEDKELLRCIELLSFSPPEADHTVYSDGGCNAIFNKEKLVDLEDFDNNGAGYLQPPIGDRTINSDDGCNANEENMVDEDDGDDNGPGYFHDGMFLIIMIIIPSLSSSSSSNARFFPSSYDIRKT
jgi:hypothetical protein